MESATILRAYGMIYVIRKGPIGKALQSGRALFRWKDYYIVYCPNWHKNDNRLFHSPFGEEHCPNLHKLKMATIYCNPLLFRYRFNFGNFGADVFYLN